MRNLDRCVGDAGEYGSARGCMARYSIKLRSNNVCVSVRYTYYPEWRECLLLSPIDRVKELYKLHM